MKNKLLVHHKSSTALLLSALIHFLLLLGLTTKSHGAKPKPIEVTLVPKKEQRQIVSPSEISSSTPPVETSQVSEKGSQTKLEQIRRGVEDGNLNEKNRNSKPKESQSNIKTLSLKPEALTKVLEQKTEKKRKKVEIQKDGRLAVKTETRQLTDRERERQFFNASPFRKRSQSVYGGQFGVSDFLPNIPDGDITLLNAKADRFAVFVRRVALQVFGALRRQSWATIPYADIQRIRGFSTLEAIMTPDGKLKEVIFQSPSGSTRFDTALLTAAKEGAWDQNPPAGAQASDGNIHFLFRSRTWSRPGTQGTREQRWLMLGTGLR